MKTAKELVLEACGPGTTINHNAFSLNFNPPVRITLNGVLPLDPDKRMTRSDRQALQRRVEDEFLEKNPGVNLVRTVIDTKVDPELLAEIEEIVKEAVRSAIERMDKDG